MVSSFGRYFYFNSGMSVGLVTAINHPRPVPDGQLQHLVLVVGYIEFGWAGLAATHSRERLV